VDIEEVAETKPEAIVRTARGPARRASSLPGARDRLRRRARRRRREGRRRTLTHLYEAFKGLDASLVEINPLVVTKDGRV
jgi:succinyl-CoA synthetase beta subunit